MSRNETKDNIASLLNEGLSAKEIANYLGLNPAGVYKHIKDLKAPAACPKCGKTDLPPKSMFCYNCGHSMLTEGQLAAKNLREAFSRACSTQFSSTAKDKLRDEINAAAYLLEKK